MFRFLAKYRARLRKWRQRRRFLGQWAKLSRTPQNFCGEGGLLLIPCDPWRITGSRGDEAMLMVLAKHFAGNRVTCVTATPESSAIAQEHGWEPLQCWTNYDSLRAICEAAESLKPSACAILGADVMDGYYSPACSEQFLALADVLRKKQIPTVLTGFSFNEHPSARIANLFRSITPDYPFLLRDPISLKRFEEATGRRGRLVADIAFLLEADKDTRLYEEILAWKRVQNRPVLGFNLHPMLRFREGREAQKRLVEDAANLMSRVLREHDWNLLLISHDDRPKVADANSLVPLYETLCPDFGERLFLCKTPPNAAQLKGLVSLADALLTSRMHLGIAAISQGIPTAAFGYQGKFEGLLAHFDLSKELLLEPPTGARLQEQAKSIAVFLDRNQEYRERIAKKLPAILEPARLNLQAFHL